MGGSESKNIQEQAFISEHPYFNDAKLLTSKEDGSKFIQARFKVQNEQYDEWQKLLEGGPTKLQSDYLLLPERTNYKHDQGLCGNTGSLTVPLPPRRIPTPTSPTPSQNSSASASPTAASSRRANSGTSSSPSPLPSTISSAAPRNSEISSQKMCS
jgi:hypothetical protein